MFFFFSGGKEIKKYKRETAGLILRKKVLRYPIEHFSILFQWESFFLFFFLIPLVYSSFPGLLIPVYVSHIPASTEIIPLDLKNNNKKQITRDEHMFVPSRDFKSINILGQSQGNTAKSQEYKNVFRPVILSVFLRL